MTKVISLGDNNFKVESSKKGRFYKVDLSEPSCSCPDFLFRERSIGGVCKHIKAAQEVSGSKIKKTEKTDSAIIKFVKQEGNVDSIKLIEKYGEEKINQLIERGELYEREGKIFILD